MDNLHKTRDWKEMFISQMTDEHLQNTVKIFLNNIKKSSDFLSWNGNLTNTIDMRLSWNRIEDLWEKFETILKQSYLMLWRYTIELFIRWINMSEDFKEAFWRDVMVEKIALLQEFTENTVDDSLYNGDEEDYDTYSYGYLD